MTFKFKADAERYNGNEDFWYALTDGGYIDPEKMLADEIQLKALEDAIDLVQKFLSQAEEEGLIGEGQEEDDES